MKTRIPTTLLKLALCTAACFSPAAQTSTLNHGFEDCRVATADELDEMRGGFDLNVGGLHLSFSIDRVTFINGALVATTSLNIQSLNILLNSLPSLNLLDTPQAIIASLQNAVGSSTGGGMANTSSSGGSGTGTAGGSTSLAGTGSSGNTGGGASGTGSSGSSSGGGSTGMASSGGSGVGTAAGSTSSAGTGSSGNTGGGASGTGSSGSSSGGGSTGMASSGGTTASAGTGSSYNPVNAIQIGPKNTLILPEGFNLSMAALNTVIQNTRDNQDIRNMTILNATLNSQALIRAMAISSSLNQMFNRSIR